MRIEHRDDHSQQEEDSILDPEARDISNSTQGLPRSPESHISVYQEEREEVQVDHDADKDEEFYDAREEGGHDTDREEGNWANDEEGNVNPAAEVGYVILEPTLTLETVPKEARNQEAMESPMALIEKDLMKAIIQRRIADYQERQRQIQERKLQEQKLHLRQELVKQFVECGSDGPTPYKKAGQRAMFMPNSILPFRNNDNPQAKRAAWLRNLGINYTLKEERSSRTGL
jgi:hypothetical protein